MSALLRLFSLPVFIASLAGVRADPAPASTWTFRPALSVRAGYDDNVFLQDSADLLPGVTNAVPDHAGSWFTRASFALETTWKQTPALQIDAAYSPELVRYDDFSSENHDNHRLDLCARGQAGAWRYQLKGGLLLADGTDVSPIYGHAGGGPAIGGVAVRSRRDQINSKLGGHLTRDLRGGFVRATADACLNDFRTHHLNTAVVPGYANYVDRCEWSAGLEAGRYVAKDFALVTGVRGGKQRQADLLGVSHNYSNTFTRFLAGVEGKPRGDLHLRILGGPALHHYDDAVAPDFQRTRTTRYIEASVTWTPTSTDMFTLTGKDYTWLSASGRCAYQHTSGNLQWKHTFNADWSLSLSGEVQAGDSRDFGSPIASRLDWIYTGTLNVSRRLGAQTIFDAEVTHEWSDSAIPDKPGREYSRWLITMGVRRSF